MGVLQLGALKESKKATAGKGDIYQGANVSTKNVFWRKKMALILLRHKKTAEAKLQRPFV
ncbi:hypothetical protein [Comamonas sp. NoAH]|uniref:hypothetical protein n=1 Tax=Comamonas halotolerans TaxID=3041496 RepID=UPI0024E160D6|nr:hypothetical protein [Comamonas sp. NoAH]